MENVIFIVLYCKSLQCCHTLLKNLKYDSICLWDPKVSLKISTALFPYTIEKVTKFGEP